MLDVGWTRRTPVVLQSEAAECGLACLLMVAGHHGRHLDLPSARQRFDVSLRGSTLADLARMAEQLDLTPRPVRLEPSQLGELRWPCVLHWDFDHYVVLERVDRRHAHVHDPARGLQRVALAELSRHFTGVALELSPASGFEPRRQTRSIPLRLLVGRPPGLAGALLQVGLLAALLQLFTIAAPLQLQWVVDQVLLTHDQDLARVLGIAFVLLAMAHAGALALRAWLLSVAGTVMKLDMTTRLFRHLVRLPLSWFEKRFVGDVTSRFDSLDQIQNTLTTSAVEALVDGIMAVTTLSLMLAYSPLLAAVALGGAGLYAALRIALYGPLRRATEQHLVSRARQQSHFLETVRGMQCIKLFAAEDVRGRAWHQRVVDQFNAALGMQRLNVVAQAGNSLVIGVEAAVTVWLGAGLVLAGSGFSVGMLLAFIAFKVQFVQRVAALVDKALELRILRLHAERIGDVVATPVEAPGAQGSACSPWACDDDAAPRLVLRGVSFRYGESEPLIIDSLDLSIDAGESVAIVGPSGCGKTTLVKLMLGLLEPTSGSIEFAGVPIGRDGLSHYRAHVASVMQDDQLFAGTIADNIALFQPAIDRERMVRSARLASIHDEIRAMPMQYATRVGDMGSVLSGGQRQRILLARAMYRAPRLLVLDEATSHLDVARERVVNESIRRLDLTRVIVAHRPETIASADRVIDLERMRARRVA